MATCAHGRAGMRLVASSTTLTAIGTSAGNARASRCASGSICRGVGCASCAATTWWSVDVAVSDLGGEAARGIGDATPRTRLCRGADGGTQLSPSMAVAPRLVCGKECGSWLRWERRWVSAVTASAVVGPVAESTAPPTGRAELTPGGASRRGGPCVTCSRPTSRSCRQSGSTTLSWITRVPGSSLARCTPAASSCAALKQVSRAALTSVGGCRRTLTGEAACPGTLEGVAATPPRADTLAGDSFLRNKSVAALQRKRSTWIRTV